MWPDVIGGLASAIDDLGETLGGVHDLAELGRIVHDDHSVTSGKRQRELLAALIDQRRRDLQHQAVAVGLRIYAEPTDQFVQRLGVYWEAWRD
jgi:hypothetical protein